MTAIKTLTKATHATLTFERSLKASPERVFKAWSDGLTRAKWDVPDDKWEVSEHAQDFRVGGMEKSRFGPKGDPIYMSVGWYLDIVPNRRIVSAGTMHGNGIPSSMTLCTIEIFPEHGGSKLVLTDQSAFIEGETPDMREDGWTTILDRLEQFLSRNS